MKNAAPFVGEDEGRAVAAVLATGWLGMGPEVAAFEGELEDRFPGRHVVAVNSGTAALHLALLALGITAGDEVVVPSLTFCATVQSVINTGASPVFVEVCPETLCIDVDDVEAHLSDRTKVVVPVHFGGNACDMDRLVELGARKSVAIIDDAAHAFGSTYKGRPIGVIGDATCFSFDPIKNLTCGEGGAIVTPDGEVADRLRRMRLLGIGSDSYARLQRYELGYEVHMPGFRYHMSDLNAAIGRTQLRKFDEIIARRRALWRRYRDGLDGSVAVRTLRHDPDVMVPFNFVVRVVDGGRDDLAKHLLAKDMVVGIHYPPNHKQPFFARSPAVSLPVTELLGAQILSLPFHPGLTGEDVDAVVREVRIWAGETT